MSKFPITIAVVGSYRNSAMALQLISSTSTTLKMALIGMVVLVLLIPLSMLRSTVQERAGMRQQAFDKVAAGWGGPLTLGGPVLVVPTERTVMEGTVAKLYREDMYILPTRLLIDAGQREAFLQAVKQPP